MTEIALFPTASAIEDSKTDVNMDALLSTLKSLETSDLLKVMKQAVIEQEKRLKSVPKAATPKKTGSMPKGQVPPQLKKPRAWVDYVMKHAMENGWEGFTVFTSKKNKETGEKTEEEVEMLGSILHEGTHIYKDSITEKNPSGKKIINKDAMSLSKQYWAPKNGTGTKEELYREFESTYVDDVPEVQEPKVVKVSAIDKVAIAEEKKLAKEKEKEDKRVAKEIEKEEKRLAKEAAKVAKVAAVPKVAAVAKVPAKVPAAAITTPVKVVKKKAEWSCPADGMVHHWPYKGKQYLRNSDNEIWIRGSDGGLGEWQGVYLPEEDRIDETVAEPEEYE